MTDALIDSTLLANMSPPILARVWNTELLFANLLNDDGRNTLVWYVVNIGGNWLVFDAQALVEKMANSKQDKFKWATDINESILQASELVSTTFSSQAEFEAWQSEHFYSL